MNLDFSFIEKIILIKSFKNLLINKIMKMFETSFNRTNKDFEYITKVDPMAVKALEMREIILCDKSMAALHGDLKFQLLEGLKNNESITEIKLRLDKIFDTTQVNTERIARTETLYAMQEGQFQSHLSSKVAKWKVWKANVGNKRTAADSLRLHNQIQPIDKPFVDPKDGKESMHSPNRPNCRCNTVYLFELPKNIIKKKGIMYLG